MTKRIRDLSRVVFAWKIFPMNIPCILQKSNETEVTRHFYRVSTSQYHRPEIAVIPCALTLNNILKIISLKNKQVKHMVDSNKNKNLIYEINLTVAGFANSARTMIWCSELNFRFENIQ